MRSSYFVEHAVETDEPAMLAARIEALTDGEFARAKDGLRDLQCGGVGCPRRGLLHRLPLSRGGC